MSVIVGIDPGLTGGIAMLCSWHGAHVWPIATTPFELFKQLEQGCPGGSLETKVFCEKGGMMPGNGTKAIFSAGRYHGMVEVACAALGYPLYFVAPVTWRTKVVGKGKDKEAARALAIQHFPELAPNLKFKNTHGMAEALLIAEWGRDYGREKA